MEPDVYETPRGLVSAQLVRGRSVSRYEELLQNYTIDGHLCLGYQLPHDPESLKLKREGTEIFGAACLFVFAGRSNVALTSGFLPPHPDLRVVADGDAAALELTQARPDGKFAAALTDIGELLCKQVRNDERLQQVTKTRRIGLGFAKLPASSALRPLVEQITAWLLAHDWSRGDLRPPSEPAIAEFVTGVMTGLPDPERPIRAQLHTNTRPMPTGKSLILSAIENKKQKTYVTETLLWLGVTAELTFGALPEVKQERVDPGQFDRIYITDRQDALVIRRDGI
jgi:hypothetical protein